MKNKVTQRVNSNSKKSILNAAEVILNGGIIVYPTDTLYGFGVDANNISAINKLNKLKGREGPISVVMQDINTIISCAKIDDVEAEIIRNKIDFSFENNNDIFDKKDIYFINLSAFEMLTPLFL